MVIGYFWELFGDFSAEIRRFEVTENEQKVPEKFFQT
jgi:hypothetical protein